MISFIMNGIIGSPESYLINEKFRENPTKFSETVKAIIQDSTISATTWNFLNAEVKDELTRLGYKHE